jgi:SagB-type dehydrogenase family enzyme
MSGEFSKKYHKQTDFDFPIGTLPSNPQYWPKEWKEIQHKEYPRLPKVKLSRSFLPLKTFEEALFSRHATREYSLYKSLSLEELSTLLYYSAGIKPQKDEQAPVRRFYPSGGARYPLEIYLAVQKVDGISPGIYHYNVKEHLIENLSDDKEDLELLKEGFYYPWSRDAAVFLFITAVWDRNFIKYKDRGYRIILMEAGHLAQNLSLTCATLKISCCNSVGFNNQRINEVLCLESEIEDSLYLAIIGK